MTERHILLIDDDSDELDFFLLAQNEMPGRFKCSYLNNPVKAVETIEHLNPDLIFLDINMPGMNGFECLSAIKKEAGFKKPVVFYSTSIDQNTEKKAAALGAAECIQKPIQVSVFRKMLQDVLSKY